MTLSLGDQLREWREAARLSQPAVAARLGVKQQTVSDWERDRSRPHYTKAKVLDELYGLPAGTVLAAMEGDPSPSDDGAAMPVHLAALGGKIGQLSDADRKYVEDLIERLLREQR